MSCAGGGELSASAGLDVAVEDRCLSPEPPRGRAAPGRGAGRGDRDHDGYSTPHRIRRDNVLAEAVPESFAQPGMGTFDPRRRAGSPPTHQMTPTTTGRQRPQSHYGPMFEDPRPEKPR